MKLNKKGKVAFYDEILERNLKKIINAKTNNVLIFFPYNQEGLLIPDHNFWSEIAKMMGNNGFLICSPNALVKARPLIFNKNYLITANEMVLRYWEEICMYLKANPKVRKIMIVSSDINIARIRRDFSIVFKENENKLNIKTKIIVVSPGFWKTIYKIREAIVFQLPIWLYKFLGRLSSS